MARVFLHAILLLQTASGFQFLTGNATTIPTKDGPTVTKVPQAPSTLAGPNDPATAYNDFTPAEINRVLLQYSSQVQVISSLLDSLQQRVKLLKENANDVSFRLANLTNSAEGERAEVLKNRDLLVQIEKVENETNGTNLMKIEVNNKMIRSNATLFNGEITQKQASFAEFVGQMNRSQRRMEVVAPRVVKAQEFSGKLVDVLDNFDKVVEQRVVRGVNGMIMDIHRVTREAVKGLDG